MERTVSNDKMGPETIASTLLYAKLRKKFMPAIIIPENTMMPTKNASPFHFGTPSLIRFDIITVKINAKKRVYVDSSLSDK